MLYVCVDFYRKSNAISFRGNENKLAKSHFGLKLSWPPMPTLHFEHLFSKCKSWEHFWKLSCCYLLNGFFSVSFLIDRLIDRITIKYCLRSASLACWISWSLVARCSFSPLSVFLIYLHALRPFIYFVKKVLHPVSNDKLTQYEQKDTRTRPVLMRWFQWSTDLVYFLATKTLRESRLQVFSHLFRESRKTSNFWIGRGANNEPSDTMVKSLTTYSAGNNISADDLILN